MLRNGKLFQVTSDHSYVAELVERGEITKEEARVHPQRNMITRALGLSRSVKVDLLKLRLHGGELFLLCTDGLSGVLTNDELKKILEKEQPLDEKAPALVKKALENGSSDNVTAMLVKVEGEPA